MSNSLSASLRQPVPGADIPRRSQPPPLLQPLVNLIASHPVGTLWLLGFIVFALASVVISTVAAAAYRGCDIPLHRGVLLDCSNSFDRQRKQDLSDLLDRVAKIEAWMKAPTAPVMRATNNLHIGESLTIGDWNIHQADHKPRGDLRFTDTTTSHTSYDMRADGEQHFVMASKK